MDEGLRQRLRGALTAAMKARDQVSVRALRSGLGAIDNAESVEVGDTDTSLRTGVIAGAASGVGATEVSRRALSSEQMLAVVRREVDERLGAADEMARAGAPDRAEQLRAEATVLMTFLDEHLDEHSSERDDTSG